MVNATVTQGRVRPKSRTLDVPPKRGSIIPGRRNAVLDVDKLDQDLLEIYGLLGTPSKTLERQITLWLICRTEYGRRFCYRNDCLLSKGWRKSANDGIDDLTIPHWNVSQRISPVGIRPELIPEFRRRLTDVMRSLLVLVRRSTNDLLRSDHAADARAKIAHYLRLRGVDISATGELSKPQLKPLGRKCVLKLLDLFRSNGDDLRTQEEATALINERLQDAGLAFATSQASVSRALNADDPVAKTLRHWMSENRRCNRQSRSTLQSDIQLDVLLAIVSTDDLAPDDRYVLKDELSQMIDHWEDPERIGDKEARQGLIEYKRSGKSLDDLISLWQNSIHSSE